MKIPVRYSFLRNTALFGLTVITQFIGIMVSFNSAGLNESLEIKILVPFLYSLLCFFVFGKGKNRKQTVIKMNFVLFGFFVALSSLLRFDYSSLTSALLYILTFLLLLGITKKYYDNSYKIICYATLLANIPYILIYSIMPLNSHGVLIAFAGILWLNIICLSKKNWLLKFVVCVFVIVLMIAVSRSRTSMLCFLFVAAHAYFHLFSDTPLVKKIILTIFGFGVMLFTYNYLESFFANVFFHKWGNPDLTSGRTFIWKYVLDNTSFNGHGINHLDAIVNHNAGGLIFDAHNSFLQALGSFGLIPFLLMVSGVFMIFRHIYKTKKGVIYANFFIGWFLISMFENLEFLTSRFTPITVLFMTHLCLLINEDEYSDT